MKAKFRSRKGTRLKPYVPKPEYNVQYRVVCAAIRFGDVILLGSRHWDISMRNAMNEFSRVAKKKMNVAEEEQGFVDQYGNFLTREEAYEMALAAGQIEAKDDTIQYYGDGSKCRPQLFSEDLY